MIVLIDPLIKNLLRCDHMTDLYNQHIFLSKDDDRIFIIIIIINDIIRERIRVDMPVLKI